MPTWDRQEPTGDDPTTTFASTVHGGGGRRARSEEDTTPHPQTSSSRSDSRTASGGLQAVSGYCAPPHAAQPNRPTPWPDRQAARRLVACLGIAATLLVVFAAPAFAAGGGGPSLRGVIDNLRNWIVGILAGVATLFLTIGGLRYLTAGGDPGQVEKAKVALKSAAIGYTLAVLAPLLVSILASIVGG